MNLTVIANCYHSSVELAHLTKVRVGNLTFDGVDSEMLHLGELTGDLGDSIRFEIRDISKMGLG